MSEVDLPAAGGIPPELAEIVGVTWAGEAAAAGVDLAGFDPAAPLAARLAWAAGRGLAVAAVLARFSTKMQQSTADQVRECVLFAARHGLYVPPEFVCADEGVSGRKRRRDGLDRMLRIVRGKHAVALLVYKLSRLFRAAYEGYKLFQEELVEEGLRGVSVSQSIDTADVKTWEQLTVLHGLSDKMLLAAIGDHVRSNLSGLFRAGYVTGALPVGYRPKEVPGRLTRRDRPRTVPEVDPAAAELIRTHYGWVRDGLPVREGWRRWVRAGGPCDPRSTTRRMSYPAYRRLLSNPRYTGVFAFGRRRNQWSSKRDYNRQVPGPEQEVVVVRSEELRVVSDELFHAVQAALARRRLGPRGPKARKPSNGVGLSDLVTDCFVCGPCTAAAPDGKDVRFYVAGSHAKGMRCKHGGLCPSPVIVNREAAVKAVCDALAARIAGDAGLVADVIGRAAARDAEGDESVRAGLETIRRRVSAWDRRIEDLSDLAGEGSDEDRRAFKAKVRAARAERAALLAEEASLRRSLAGVAGPVTPGRVRELLSDLAALRGDAAAGRLGEDVVTMAGEAFRRLVGGRVVVHAVPRPGRKWPDVRAAFTPDLPAAARDGLGLPGVGAGTEEPAGEVEVWLRRRACDSLAGRAAALVDRDGLSCGEAAATLAAEGHRVSAKRVWALRRRHYEMVGLPVPPRPYNGGRSRRAAAVGSTDEAA